MKLRLLSIAASLAAVSTASAASLDLKFGGVGTPLSVPTFGTTVGSTIGYGLVDTTNNVYATLTSLNTFTGFTPANNGAVEDDLRVNVNNMGTASLRLSLWADAAYSVPYTSASYDYALTFYDLDGTVAGGYDAVTILTAATFELFSPTLLSSTGAGNYNASTVERQVSGENGLTSFNVDQASVAVTATFTNVNVVDFNYSVSQNGTRNLIVDGGGLRGAIAAVPEVSSSLMAMLGVCMFGLRRRRNA